MVCRGLFLCCGALLIEKQFNFSFVCFAYDIVRFTEEPIALLVLITYICIIILRPYNKGMKNFVLTEVAPPYLVA